MEMSEDEASKNFPPQEFQALGAEAFLATFGVVAAAASHYIARAFFAQVYFVDPDGHWPSKLYLRLLYGDTPRFLIGLAFLCLLYYGFLLLLPAENVLRRMLGQWRFMIRGLMAMVIVIGVVLVVLGVFGLMATSSTGYDWVRPYW